MGGGEVVEVEGDACRDDGMRARGAVLSRSLELQRDRRRAGGPGDAPVVLERLSDVHGQHPVERDPETYGAALKPGRGPGQHVPM